jgi:hypothetical protein
MPDVSGVRGLVFRANPAYELVVYDRLSPTEKSALSALTSDADFYGILRPKVPGLNLKSVNRDLALLFSTMANPGTMPSYVEAELGRSFAGFVTQLVLDQVFEVEHEGTFVSAASAQHLFGAERGHRPASRISELSQRAVQYAQHLDIDEAAVLGARIYFYNRQPASPQLAAEFLGEGRLAKHLGINEETPFGTRLKQKWSKVPEEPTLQGWRMWRSKRRHKGKSGSGYKLYVSPQTPSLGEAFRASADVFERTGVQQFKVGRDLHGILRPDKLVAYFSSEDDVRETGERLYAKLGGMPAHGVPFTCDLHGDGLLSWGMDPPRRTQVLPWQERQSWRLWVVNRLAIALLAAKARPSTNTEPWKFALDRVRFDGVETNSWMPAPDIFQRGGET